jgi:membrane fusion protein, multidrug efflux system
LEAKRIMPDRSRPSITVPRRLAASFAVASVATALALAGCGTSSHADSAPPPATAPVAQVDVTRPTRGDVMRRIDFVATLKPWEEATVYAKTSGYVRSMRVDRGDRVRAGDVLTILDVPEMDEEHRRLEAKATHDKAEIERARAEVEVQDLTVRRLKAIQAEAADATTQQEVDLAVGKLAAARATLAAATSELAQTQADVARLETMIGYSRITAPFDGTVTERLVDPGALVTAGTQSKPTPIVTIVNPRRLRTTIDVPERDVAPLEVGATARLTMDAYPDRTFTGRISRISGALDPRTRTMRAEVLIENRDDTLKPGMFGRLSLDLEKRMHVVTLVPTALKFDKDQPYVFVVNDGHARRVRVETGADDGEHVEIVSGLSGGELIVVRASEALIDGTPVAISSGAMSNRNPKEGS